MQAYMSFFAEHWVLSGLFIAVLIALVVLENYSTKGGGFRLTPADVVKLINHEEAVVLDVREQEAFQHGHIVNAIHIPADQVESSVDKLKQHENRLVVVVGDTDQQAMKVAGTLEKQAFENVKILAGGMRAWQSASMPLEKI